VLLSNWTPSSPKLARQLSSTVLITVHPGHVSPAALSRVTIVVLVGGEPQVMLDAETITRRGFDIRSKTKNSLRSRSSSRTRSCRKTRPVNG